MRILLFFLLAHGLTAMADEPLKIGGSLDFYYEWNFLQPPPVSPPADNSSAQPPGNNRYRIFDPYHDDISLALAELTLQKTVGDVRLFIALDFGSTAEVLSPADEVTKNISQANLTYTPHEAPNFNFMLGKMLTHMGWETMRTKDNWNYSRSVLFGYAIPFWHTGLAARGNFLDGKLSAGLFLYNKTYGLYQNNRGKTYGAQMHYQPLKPLGVTYNFLIGPEQGADGATHGRTLNEAIVGWEILPDLSFALDTILGTLTAARDDGRTAQWFAWSAALKWTRGRFYLAPRFEVYTDTSGASIEIATLNKPALPLRISTSTLTAAYDCGGGLEARLEVRDDETSSASFTNAGGTLEPSQWTSTLGILYDF